MKALNAAYGIADHRTWWGKRVIAIALTVVLSLFTLTALLLLVFGGRLGEAIADFVGLGPVHGGLEAAAAAGRDLAGPHWLDARLLPGPSRRSRLVLDHAGSAFACVSWLLMSLGLRFYVGYFGNYKRDLRLDRRFDPADAVALLQRRGPAAGCRDRFDDRAGRRRARGAARKRGRAAGDASPRRLIRPAASGGKIVTTSREVKGASDPMSRPLTRTTRARSAGIPRRLVTSVTCCLGDLELGCTVATFRRRNAARVAKSLTSTLTETRPVRRGRRLGGA